MQPAYQPMNLSEHPQLRRGDAPAFAKSESTPPDRDRWRADLSKQAPSRVVISRHSSETVDSCVLRRGDLARALRKYLHQGRLQRGRLAHED